MYMLILVPLVALVQFAAPSALALHSAQHDVVRRQSTNATVLECFQVETPIVPTASDSCFEQKVLMEYSFAQSYGQPFVGNYTPPSCDFNSVAFNFTVTARGRQFDRLWVMYLGDIEVWRGSTAEPTQAGIIWTYTKDMSQYLSLWKQPQTIIFDLGNLIDSTYTSPFNTTLTATFYNKEDAPTKADLILPISREQGSSGGASVFEIPAQNASVQQTLPSNVTHASISLAANGQIGEEFWFTNVLQEDVYTFNDTVGALPGYGTFREVQLFIDGMMAGVAWPFPIIFTGGVAPGFWRPIVGIDAFDLREYEIDITPFLPYLLDGLAHTYEIRVVGVDPNGGNGPATVSAASIGSYWLVTGKIFLFYGNSLIDATGIPPTIIAPDLDLTTSRSLTTLSNGTNSSLTYSSSASRTFSVSSALGTWTQDLDYTNTGEITAEGYVQTNTQHTSGTLDNKDLTSTFSSSTSFSYPITVNTTFTIFPEGGIGIDGSLDRGLIIDSSGRPDISVYTWVAGESSLDTTQFGEAHYSSKPNASYSFGDTTQHFKETTYGNTYTRDVRARNQTILYDTETGGDGYGTVTGGATQQAALVGPSSVRPAKGDTRGGPRAFIGRGPGQMVQGGIDGTGV